MSLLKAWLFGKPEFSCEACPCSFELPCKSEELFCYLLYHRGRKHSREQLAEMLWQNLVTEPGRPYFRKALWQLQVSLKKLGVHSIEDLLDIEEKWIQINPQAELWVDVSALEQSFDRTRDLRGFQLSSQQFEELGAAASLYRGELLEGSYQDWCIVERERCKEIYLLIIDKLMSYCETHQRFDTGIAYGHKLLSFDSAHELTHYRLMRLKYLAGDRTGALRQYEICRKALQQELNVEPAKRTRSLAKHISSDLPLPGQPHGPVDSQDNSEMQTLRALEHIAELQTAQSVLQVELQREMAVLEALLAA
jgi:DNA-binding SARP family transcriptional activator